MFEDTPLSKKWRALMKQDEIIFKTNHTIFHRLFFSIFLVIPLISIIPFFELKPERFDFKIVLFQGFVLIIQLFFNWANGYDLIYTNEYLNITRTIFLKTSILVPSTKINGFSLSLISDFRMSLYRFKININDEIKEFRLLNLNKKSIEDIGTIKNNKDGHDGVSTIKQIRSISLKTIPNLCIATCLVLSFVLAIKNAITA